MNRYVVYFLYNHRGMAACDWIASCELPAGLGVQDIREGFWIDDTGIQPGYSSVKYITMGGNMWVPPGRITSIVRAEGEGT